MRIRPENIHDAVAIRSVQYHAYNEHQYSYLSEYKIVDALREENALALSLVAEDERDGVIGHATISPITINGNGVGWYYLGPVGVLPEHQKHGVGSALITQAVRAAYGMGAEGLVSQGDPRFFKRFGFRNDTRLSYNQVQPEHVVMIPMGKTVPQGAVTLHPAYFIS